MPRALTVAVCIGRHLRAIAPDFVRRTRSIVPGHARAAGIAGRHGLRVCERRHQQLPDQQDRGEQRRRRPTGHAAHGTTRNCTCNWELSLVLRIRHLVYDTRRGRSFRREHKLRMDPLGERFASTPACDLQIGRPHPFSVRPNATAHPVTLPAPCEISGSSRRLAQALPIKRPIRCVFAPHVSSRGERHTESDAWPRTQGAVRDEEAKARNAATQPADTPRSRRTPVHRRRHASSPATHRPARPAPRNRRTRRPRTP